MVLIDVIIHALLFRSTKSEAKHNDDEEEEVIRAIMGDKGFEGFEHVARTISPFKSVRDRTLSDEKTKINEQIGVLMWLQRTFTAGWKGKFKISSTRFGLERANYDAVIACCVALINNDVALHPLRRDDHEKFEDWIWISWFCIVILSCIWIAIVYPIVVLNFRPFHCVFR